MRLQLILAALATTRADDHIHASHAAIEAPLFAQLESLEISFQLWRHPPVMTVEQAKRLRGPIPACHVKNLLLRDKKRRLWLLTLPESRQVVLKSLRPLLGARGGPSFASPELMRQTLGVEPGSVTPLGALNDTDCRVTVVLDRTLLDCEQIAVHPLHNAATIALSPGDLLRFLESTAHTPELLDLPAPPLRP